MSERAGVCAAQYLRMSTEHQRYSLSAQAQAIAQYAAAHGYEIDRTYFDPGESGLTFQNRVGLRSLLAAACDPARTFEAVLVLDVSRWGRFQDIDEAAHYEYLCRSAGVRVVYCAEPFDDDTSSMASLLKALKRIMAAEFSRELSSRVKWARLQQARLGFFLGGRAVYGVRRTLVDPDGVERAELVPGVRKAFAGDRVVLRPGAPAERAAMRLIFRRYTRDGRGLETIARELNTRGVESCSGRPWCANNVRSVLENELAIGLYVTQKSDQTLNRPRQRRPQDEWLRVRVFPPIVPPAQFRAAAKRLGRNEREALVKPDMLRALRQLLRREGRLNARIINRSRDTPYAQTYRKYFGSLNTAYALISYMPRRPRSMSPSDLHEALLQQLRQAYQRHGYLTGKVIEKDPALPVVDTYRKYFGTLAHAYALAGLPHDKSELITGGHQRARAVRRALGNLSPLNIRSPLSNEALLEALHDLFHRGQFVSAAVLDQGPAGAGASLYRRRFGSLVRAYVLAGLPDEFLNRSRLRRFIPHLAEPSSRSPNGRSEFQP